VVKPHHQARAAPKLDLIALGGLARSRAAFTCSIKRSRRNATCLKRLSCMGALHPGYTREHNTLSHRQRPWDGTVMTGAYAQSALAYVQYTRKLRVTRLWKVPHFSTQKERWGQSGVESLPPASTSPIAQPEGKRQDWRSGFPLTMPAPFPSKEEEMSGYPHERKVPTAAQREAHKAFKEADAKVAMSEYERTQQAFHANRERLKAERLAREGLAQDLPQREERRRKSASVRRR
jgi:hypothetical protein